MANDSISGHVDRRSVLKTGAALTGLSTLGGVGTAVEVAEESEVFLETDEDAWRMVGYDPATTGFNPVATGPEPPIEVNWQVSGLPGYVWPPLVAGDTAYVASVSHDPPAGDLRAFSTASGVTRWTYVPSERPTPASRGR